jgi:hypothetical protein
MWIDGVELDMTEFLIYLIKHYGLEEKASGTGFEITIMVDGKKLHNYCIHITCDFKMTDTDARDPLVVGKSDPLKRGKLLFDTMQ